MTATRTTLPLRLKKGSAVALAVATLALAAPVTAQKDKVALKPVPAATKRFGALAEGPYERLVIRNVMVIPGNGGPARGPFDILVTGNVIAEMRRFDPLAEPSADAEPRLSGDRIIEGDGKYVMPGMINLHLHFREDALPLDYIYYMQLATGVTSVGPAEDERVAHHLEAERNNEILAPRLFPIYSWGSTTDFSEAQLRDPALAPRVARAMAGNGVRQVYLNQLCWNAELFGAAAKAIEAEGMISAVHIQPSRTSEDNALDDIEMLALRLLGAGASRTELARRLDGLGDCDRLLASVLRKLKAKTLQQAIHSFAKLCGDEFFPPLTSEVARL